MQYFFGSGAMYARVTGGSATPTPVRFGAIQNASIDFAATNKPLFGQYSFPVDVARGTTKVTGKCSFAQLNGITFNQLFFNTVVTGTNPVFTAIDEQQTVAANAATVTNNTTYVEDLGVLNLTSGLIMTRVASAPASTGNYAVNESTGVYTFNSAMNTVVVAISYDYSAGAGNGTLTTMQNSLMGNAPTFLLVLSGTLKGKAMRLKLNQCLAAKVAFATKLEDYAMPDMEFDSFVDSAGNLGQWSFAE